MTQSLALGLVTDRASLCILAGSSNPSVTQSLALGLVTDGAGLCTLAGSSNPSMTQSLALGLVTDGASLCILTGSSNPSVTRRCDLSLLLHNSVANGAGNAVRHTSLSTGSALAGNGDLSVTQCSDLSLRLVDLLADAALLAFGQTGGGAGSGIAGQDNLSVNVRSSVHNQNGSGIGADHIVKLRLNNIDALLENVSLIDSEIKGQHSLSIDGFENLKSQNSHQAGLLVNVTHKHVGGVTQHDGNSTIGFFCSSSIIAVA